MKRTALILAAVSLCAATAGGGPGKVGSDLDLFRYQPDRIRVGEVAHYLKSNLDGSKPTRVSIFVVAPDRIEVAKIEEEVGDAAWVRAHFDGTLFTSDEMKAAVGDRKGSAAWRQLPFHVYNFDFTSLNFAWRHLVDPRGPWSFRVSRR